jgi:hypothetical protein
VSLPLPAARWLLLVLNPQGKNAKRSGSSFVPPQNYFVLVSAFGINVQSRATQQCGSAKKPKIHGWKCDEPSTDPPAGLQFSGDSREARGATPASQPPARPALPDEEASLGPQQCLNRADPVVSRARRKRESVPLPPGLADIFLIHISIRLFGIISLGCKQSAATFPNFDVWEINHPSPACRSKPRKPQGPNLTNGNPSSSFEPAPEQTTAREPRIPEGSKHLYPLAGKHTMQTRPCAS